MTLNTKAAETFAIMAFRERRQFLLSGTYSTRDFDLDDALMVYFENSPFHGHITGTDEPSPCITDEGNLGAAFYLYTDENSIWRMEMAATPQGIVAYFCENSLYRRPDRALF